MARGKRMPEPRRRRRRRSPLQKALEPGTLDFTPLTTPVVVVVPDPAPKDDPTTTKPGTRARTHTANLSGKVAPGCAGQGWEDRDFQHAEEIDLVLHLQIFFSHTWAERFVEEFGRRMINQALGEIPSWRGVKMPAAFLVNRVRAMSQGALPIPPAPAETHRPDGTHRDPEVYLKEYVRRRGHLPGEEKE